VKATVEACRVAKEAAATAAEGIATASCALLNTLRDREKELDRLDMELTRASPRSSLRSPKPKPANSWPA